MDALIFAENRSPIPSFPSKEATAMDRNDSETGTDFDGQNGLGADNVHMNIESGSSNETVSANNGVKEEWEGMLGEAEGFEEVTDDPLDPGNLAFRI